MSVHAAYKALMESRVPSSEDLVLQGTCREWIWEFLLKHCANSALVRALAAVFPVPDNSLHLKRLLYLKSLSFDLAEYQVSDRTLETISALCSLHCAEHRSLFFNVPVSSSDGSKSLYQFSLYQLLLAVRVECTIQNLREDKNDWPRFYESLEKYWGDYADDTQEPEHVNIENDGETFLELKEELWAVQKQPELRHDLLKRRKRQYVMRMMQNFLSDAWKDVGNSFLEDVANKLKQGLYVPAGFASSIKETVSEAEMSLPGEQIGAPYTKSPGPLLSKVLDQKIVGTSSPKTVNKGSSEPSTSMLERPDDVHTTKSASNKGLINHTSSAGQYADTSGLANSINMPHGSLPPYATKPTVGKNTEGPSTSKELDKGPHLTSKLLLESLVDASDSMEPRDGSGCAKPTPVEQDNRQQEPLWRSKRRIPTSLQEMKKTNSITDASQTGKWAEKRVTRSSLLPHIAEREPALVDGSSGHGQENNGLLERPNSKDTRVCSPGSTEQRDQFGRDFEQGGLICPSPLPWAESPGMTGTVTIRKRPRKTPFCLNEILSSKNDTDELRQVGSPVILKAQSELRDGQASLSAAVKDPLPEALKIAEEAAKTSDLAGLACGQTHSVNDLQSLSKTNNNVIGVLEGAARGSQEKRSRKNIMDRNPTAHTVEWDTSDDISESSDDKSPSHSRKIHLPKIQSRHSSAFRDGKLAHKEPRRRKIQKWTEEEVNVLRSEVERYGKGHWKHILQKHKDVFEGRTEVDLKDKWRNIERREGIF